jgi:hypothetical protein
MLRRSTPLDEAQCALAFDGLEAEVEPFGGLSG